ncbi:helix-turn-helix domain-containing protein [Balneolaceae bacterium YR4-1]|uniref:Helix-turn-helix domain-containing protein n=1 Tax=Halalkalibaculum roseum TaxID=2709311 RepID=A0A6M1T052_9BACT|nr:helix-turn-helix domain-containing protein [Halalkalibaculum roseum]NGP75475.1 helix-turn-helix domain-containing protein [Halalkalibaculum roseum]
MSSALHSKQRSSRDSLFIKKLNKVVEEYITEGDLSVENISRELGISTSTFYRKVKSITGYSPVEYIRNLQLQKAVDLLSKNYGNVSEVAYESGFNNLSYFSKCFREKFGVNPARYSKLRISRSDSFGYHTSFIGREEELLEIKTLITKNRLVSLIGPAGTGKTRLGTVTMKDLGDTFRDGSFAVYLTSINDPELVPSVIQQSLRIPLHPNKSVMKTLVDYLASKELLLLIDNFEHVIEARSVIEELLAKCNHLRIILTSRTTLKLKQEIQYLLQPLSTPAPVKEVNLENLDRIKSYPAIHLFIDRAKNYNSEFDLTKGNISTIIDICYKLDGLPLALELAATQLRLIAPKDLLNRLDYGLSILKSGQLERSKRHDSLLNAIEWSYDLLSNEEQIYFQRLSLIPDSFGLHIAESLWVKDIGTNFIVHIQSLIDNNLIQSFEEDGEIRFKILETLKLFGRKKLRESEKEHQIVKVLAEYYVKLARKAEVRLNGPEQNEWINHLNRERDNFRGIMAYLLEHREVRFGLQLANALWRYWNMQNMIKEGISWLQKVIRLADRLKSHELTSELYELKGNALSVLGITQVIHSENIEEGAACLLQS